MEIKIIRNIVYKLLKALYSLKQSPCFWYKRFSTFFFKKLGLKYIHVDHNIFITTVSLKNPVLSVFINNIKIIVLKNSGIIRRVKTKLTTIFFILDMGLISFHLERKID